MTSSGNANSLISRYRSSLPAAGTVLPRGVALVAIATVTESKRSPGSDRLGNCRLPRAWFRRQIWNPALTAAGLTFQVRFHDLRHAHASWLLAGGSDIQTVKERMGHSSITTTQKYLHTLPNADHAAVAALDNIRKRSTP